MENLELLHKLEENELLFGNSKLKKIVSIEITKDSKAKIYLLDDNFKTYSLEYVFEPFILLTCEQLVYDAKSKPTELKELKGNHFFKYIAKYRNINALEDTIKHLQQVTGLTPSAANAPYFYISDYVHQFMLLTGYTYFKSMRFSDLRRLIIDIETNYNKDYGFSNAKREDDSILLIGVYFTNDNDVEYVSLKDMSEPEMINWLNDIIKKYDPDTIEGHNIFKFDLPYIYERAKLHKIKLNWGRDGSEIKFRKSRVQIAERTIDYTRCDIFGRSVVDTWLLAQFYDIQTRNLESFNLKHLAKHFNVSPKDRVYIEYNKMKEYFDNNYDMFLKYNKDDLIETALISEILSYSYFVQATIFPYSYQNCIVRGNATKINSLFLREYIRQGYSIPNCSNQSTNVEFEGGYTDIFVEGVIKNVAHCDVRSLYPSIMLTYKIFPSCETHNIFLPMLDTLREYRLKAKELMKHAKSESDRKYYDALQGAFKILINSFYGYLGSPLHNFSDVFKAAEVTKIGREIIKKIIELLKQENCIPIEIDTDGVYFVHKFKILTDAEYEEIINKINNSLDPGIEVEFDGKYKAMLSFKMKNYALLDYNNNLILKGAALKSRGLEKFLRNFTNEIIYLILNDEAHKINDLYNNYYKLIETKKMSISDICKTETITEPLKTYENKVKNKKRNPAAHYELALKSKRDFQPGDQISYYITGNTKKVTAYNNCKLKEEFDETNPDYNVPYYLDKLENQYKKFLELVPSQILNESNINNINEQQELLFR